MTALEPILEVRGVSKEYYPAGGLAVRAVDSVDLAIRPGEAVGLVGESGCGKTTLGRLIIRLLATSGGSILFRGKDVTQARGAELKAFRQEVQMVFQDPYSSLNPRLTIEQIVGEPLHIHRVGSRRERRRTVAETLDLVGIPPAAMDRAPASLSGGQRQRVSIARALVLRPRVLVLDEPVSALDLSVQAQILEVLASLQESLGLTYLFISHDLSVVRQITNVVAVMYLGRLVEHGPTEDVFAQPGHPYTRALISAVPLAFPDASRRRIVLSGDIPDPSKAPSGCAFRTRCWMARDICTTERPALERRGALRTLAACHFAEEAAAAV
jgi:oligopeptide/dipeptide ABC transporter ATP-binding protein